jgi:predicted phage tail protein
MVNLKLGGVLLAVGAMMFLMSDTLFGESDLASYLVFSGLIMFPVGVILTAVGIVQVLVAKLKGRTNQS